MEIFLSGVLSLGSLAYFHRLASNSDSQSRANSSIQAYGLGDVIFSTVLVLFFLTNIIGSANRPLEMNTRVLIFGAAFTFFLIAIVLGFLILRSHNPVELFGLRGADLPGNLKAAGVGLVAALPAVYFVHSLCLRLIGEDAEPQPLLQFLANNPSLSDRLLLIGTALIIAPVAEELIFRGYIFGVLRRYAGRWWAMVISGMVFAAIHAHIPSLAGLFVLAVALTLVYEGAGSLWASIFMHSLFNGITVILTLGWPDLVK